MNEKHTSKADTPFEADLQLIRGVGEVGITLTADEVEAALARLQRSVQGEPVSDIWRKEDIAGQPSFSSFEAPLQHAPRAPEQPGLVAHVDLRAHVDPQSQGGGAGGETQSGSRANSRRRKQRRFGRMAVGTAAAAVLVGVLFTPLGTRAIADAMQTLYFQNLVGVGDDDLTQIQNALSQGVGSGSSRIDLKQYGSIEVSGGDRMGRQVSLAQAEKLSGYQVKLLPGVDPQHGQIYYTPGADLTFRLNIFAINSLIKHFGGTTQFPASVNGEPIVVHVSAQVSQQFMGSNGKYSNLTLMQMPTVQVPADVDLNQVRQALLALPFLPGDIRQSLSTAGDWKSTLYVPVGGQAVDVSIDGNPAVVQAGGSGMNPSIIWLENGMLYQLSGSDKVFPTLDALEAQAKELAQ